MDVFQSVGSYDAVNLNAPDTEATSVGDFFQGLVFDGRIRQRNSPASFEQVGAQVFAFIKMGCIHSTPSNKAAVSILLNNLAAHKTLDFELKGEGCS